jgi:uncharacterized protein YhbP (UPF0306 family)
LSGDALLHRVQEYLHAHHVMTLATCGPAGAAAAAVFYAHAGSTLYFLSSPASLHARNIELDPRVAMTIQHDCSEWTAIRGLQLDGIARRLEREEESSVRTLYAAKFAFIGALARMPASLREALAKVSWYEVSVSRGRLIDNTLGFGHREEFRLE